MNICQRDAKNEAAGDVDVAEGDNGDGGDDAYVDDDVGGDGAGNDACDDDGDEFLIF